MTIQFLQPADYLTFVSEEALRKLLHNNESKLTASESNAYGYIYEKLSARYRIDQEIGHEGESRNLGLVRWMVILAVYYLYQSVPDGDMPERVRLNYEDVLKELDRVASGRDNCTLAPVTDSTGKPRTSFRWSGQPRRSHNPFS